MLKGRLLGSGYLTDEKIQEMAESFYNCTVHGLSLFSLPVLTTDHVLTYTGVISVAYSYTIEQPLYH